MGVKADINRMRKILPKMGQYDAYNALTVAMGEIERLEFELEIAKKKIEYYKNNRS